MDIKIKKLHESAVIPQYSKPDDSGMDLTAISVNVVNEDNFGYIEYDTGLAMEIPEDYVGLIFPRSSISNTGLWLANAVGVVDPGYRGSIKCRFKAVPNTNVYEVGERIAQIIIIPRPPITFVEVSELTDTSRADGGFGSSGK